MPDYGAIRLTGLDGVLKTLEQLPPEIVSKAGGPVKAALKKGALVIATEAALNVARNTQSLTNEEDRTSTGLLAASIIASRGKPPSSGKGERYLVRVKRKVYTRKGKPVTTLQTGNLLEYGSEKQPAEPWIRPAFNAKAVTAIQTIERELIRSVERVVAKLARQNGGR